MMDGKVTLLCGNALEVLRNLPEGIAQCCVTSPPYWGLRDYKNPPLVWGGDPDCPHEFSVKTKAGDIRFRPGNSCGVGGNRDPGAWQGDGYGALCQKCGAFYGQLGLEPSIELYIKNLVDIFGEVRRVLRKDGTIWVNLGDFYMGSGQGWSKWKIHAGGKQATNRGSIERTFLNDYGYERPPGYISSKQRNGLKPKDLAGIPWRVAFALQADGWYLRSDIIWDKTNPMPESVKDRPTQSHEYIFFLSVNSKYFYCYDAVKEPSESGPSDIKKMVEKKNRIGGKTLTADDPLYAANKNTNIGNKRAVGSPEGRNCRSVWRIATVPFSGSHLATFPPALAERCILAGSKKGDVILDPFSGAGTTGLVAYGLGRKYIGIDINQDYIEMSRERILGPIFARHHG